MKTSTKALFKTIKSQGKGNIVFPQETFIKECSRKEKSTALERCFLQMEINMMGCGKMGKNMEKEFIIGVMGIVMKAVFGWTSEKEMGLFFMGQEEGMKDIGKTIKKKGKEYSSMKTKERGLLMIELW